MVNIYLTIYLVIAAIGTVFEIVHFMYHSGKVLTPKHIYKHTKMNMLFCFLSFLVIGFVSPLMFVCKIVYWLAHIRRKPDKKEVK